MVAGGGSNVDLLSKRLREKVIHGRERRPGAKAPHIVNDLS
jgi:hypothetical protein